MKKPVVAIVGRPNVGKSTLFNRLVGRRVAVVADTPGVTRDRLYQDVEWEGRKFTLVDTGGLFLEDPVFGEKVEEQVARALEEADVVVFLVDSRAGPTVEDERIARMLLKNKKNVVLAANKVDNFRESGGVYSFLSLGLGEPVPISALHGTNVDVLLDAVVALLPPEAPGEEDSCGPRVALAGRPNVGKSSLINALLREERLLVSDIPGTTRDAVDTVLRAGEKCYIFIDTSGIRRKSRVAPGVERYSVARALRAIDRADVVLLVLDASEGVVEQDKKIGGYILEAGKGLVIVANKWDLVKKDAKRAEAFAQEAHLELAFLTSFAPLLKVSALTGEGLGKILKTVDLVAAEQEKRISTGRLNSWLAEVVAVSPVPAAGGREVKIYYTTQVGVKPPTFVFFTNNPDGIPPSYRRYLEHQLRRAFGFTGTPVRFIFRLRS